MASFARHPVLRRATLPFAVLALVATGAAHTSCAHTCCVRPEPASADAAPIRRFRGFGAGGTEWTLELHGECARLSGRGVWLESGVEWKSVLGPLFGPMPGRSGVTTLYQHRPAWARCTVEYEMRCARVTLRDLEYPVLLGEADLISLEEVLETPDCETADAANDVQSR